MKEISYNGSCTDQPWKHLARQILLDEFEDADEVTLMEAYSHIPKVKGSGVLSMLADLRIENILKRRFPKRRRKR